MFIRQMTYLVALAKEEHFGRAAEACNVTQPTLSSGLKALERELDMRLVHRGPRFIGLTPEGERVVAWAGQILSDYESLKRDVEGFRGCLKGTLQIGVIPAATPAVAQLTGPFAEKHPQVAIAVHSMTSVEIQRALDKFELDAGITYLENEPLLNVRKAALYRERYLYVTQRSSRWANEARISWREAVASQLCLLNESMQNRRVLNNLAGSIGLELAPMVTTNSFLSVCSHVCSGKWSSIIPHTFAYIFAGCEELAMLDLVDPVHVQTIGMVVTDRDPLPPLARAFMTSATRQNLELNLASASLVSV
ncbi:LysR family transcriptional regulator [Hyphomicrobium nitrativorans NL23]|uniref:LysR family transcriptional regulator n=1 Tax=Hyphomicrobium nitrativorans NL23 TaxID=1029756 RepID=V5SD11_9HYPH|nr:LysR family transcriptional regulator [Hyphomicrobium nitrativorans]AHB48367.1 LysR family transcriptional regulator [Hyphomicrobium nitrativorans NL23]